ncbi:MAG: hypothetical protein ACHQIO_03845 [Nevskiales bacterium]
MTNAKTRTTAEMAVRLAREEGAARSFHFDQIENYSKAPKEGLSLLHYACSVLSDARHAIVESEGTVNGNKPLIYFPLKDSEDIKLWSEHLWGELGGSNEPPSLYLISDEPFQMLAEEYRRPIPLHSTFSGDYSAIYRCFRNPDAVNHSWEFTVGIYLFFRNDFQ